MVDGTRTRQVRSVRALLRACRPAGRGRLTASPVLLLVIAALAAASWGGRAVALNHAWLSPAAHAAPAHAAQAGATQTRATPAGVDQAGTTQAGAVQAGTTQARAKESHAAPTTAPVVAPVPTTATQSAPPCTGAAPGPPPPPPGLTAEQLGNARIIAQVAHDRGLPQRAVVIALATAQQESKLIDLPYGDLDSLGLFQQRPSQGWGTPEQLQDPAYAAGRFYDLLVQVPGWNTGRLTDVAQTVQRSGFPDRYQQWEGMATALAASLAPAPAAVPCP